MPRAISERAQSLFAAALELAESERAAFLAKECAGDAALADRVQRLLAADAQVVETTLRPMVAGFTNLLAGMATVDKLAGTRVGAYELREELGRGGMGVVFRAARVDGKIQHEVAIKIVQRLLLDENGLRRFQMEREIVAGFHHPYIARLYDVGETADGSPYLVMELIKGQTITAYCDGKHFKVRQRLALLLHVCEAVQHAHARLVLHRDIKPANVLVTEDGTPKLIDFGIAKPMVLGAEGERTGTQQRFFSPSNAAPEQIRGGSAGVACDVYQLGTLLYELLCGATLFEARGLTAAKLEEMILAHVPEAPSVRLLRGDTGVALARNAGSPIALAKQLQGDLDNITLQALRKAPEERYASVEQFAEDIQRYLADEPVVAQRGQRWYRARKFLRRNRMAVVLAALAIFTANVFVAAILLQSNRLETERDAARQERDRAERVTQFMANVFKSADPSQALGGAMPITKALENGRRQMDAELQNEPAIHVRLLGVLSEVYFNLSERDTALQLLDEAEETLQSSGPIDDRAMIDYALRRADVLHQHSDFVGARAAAQQAIDSHVRLGDAPGGQWRARQLMLRASHDLMDRAESMKQLRALLRDMENEPSVDAVSLANMRLELGHNLGYGHENADAETLIRQAILGLEQALPKNHPKVVNARVNLADLLDRNLNRSADALPIHAESLAEQKRLFGARSAVAADTMVRIGLTLSHLGRHDEALPILFSAREILAEQRTWPHHDFTIAESVLGQVYEAMGRLDESGDRYVEAMRVADAINGPNGANSLSARARLGALRVKQGRLEEAEGLLGVAVRAASFEFFGHAKWGVDYAEVLHRLNRDAEAAAQLERVQPLLHKFPDASKTLRERVDRLRLAIKANQ